MTEKPASWDDAVKFHGHSCLGLAMGYRVSEAALEKLGSSRDKDEELVAIVENDSCAVDAVQCVTGCTMGKGNLFFKDHGKQVYTFVLRKSKKAVRIVALGLDENEFPELGELRKKVFSGEATEKEKQLFSEAAEEAVRHYLAEPLEKVVNIEEVTLELPEKARIFNSVTCSRCGEKVMEPRARVEGGKPVCIPCTDHYARRV